MGYTLGPHLIRREIWPTVATLNKQNKQFAMCQLILLLPCLRSNPHYCKQATQFQDVYDYVSFSLIFQLAGFMTIGIGVWIRWDKSSEIRQLLEEVVDPAVMVIIAGEDLTYCFTNVLLICTSFYVFQCA